jgi:hypothetical protein
MFYVHPDGSTLMSMNPDLQFGFFSSAMQPDFFAHVSHGIAQGQALASLADAQDLQRRFYSWRGLSGRSYVCSIFQKGEHMFVSQLTHGVIVGVARLNNEARAVCVLSSKNFTSCADIGLLAKELQISEWHVHFSDADSVVQDLSASLLSYVA